MGRLLFRGISTFILYASVGAAVLSTNKKDLERAAELAVERAAEKAAERAVEKALNSGNSSTITVTVKESYSNAQKTAEEAAAPGSESTRPYNPKIYNSQYAYEARPSMDSSMYKPTGADIGAGIGAGIGSGIGAGTETGTGIGSREEGGEYAGSSRDVGGEQSSGEYEASSELSAESMEEHRAPLSNAAPVKERPRTSFGSEIDVGADFDHLDVSSDANFRGNFGLKKAKTGRTQTFSRSYSSPKSVFPEIKVDVDDHEDAQIFKIYASQLQKDGWSSARQKGWVRHRPLWDDKKISRGSQEFWDGFRDMSASESTFSKGKDQSYKDRQRSYVTNQFSLPEKTIDFGHIDHLSFYQGFPRQEEEPRKRTQSYRSKSDESKGPLKLFLTIPIAYPQMPKLQRDQDQGRIIDHAKYLEKHDIDRGALPGKQIRSYGLESGGLFFISDSSSTPSVKRKHA